MIFCSAKTYPKIIALLVLGIALPLACSNSSAQNDAGKTEVANGKTIRLEYSPHVADYAPVVIKALNDLADAGGGTLEVPFGKYPLATRMQLEIKKEVNINIRGVKNAAGQRPAFYTVSEPGTTHRMFVISSGFPDNRPTLDISGLEFIGNNPPVDRLSSTVPGDDGVSFLGVAAVFKNRNDGLNYGHPFMFRGGKDLTADDYTGDAIRATNMRALTVEDVKIRDVYGNGIVVTATQGDADQRVESVKITNTEILNTWQWEEGDLTGDGIYIAQAKQSLIENCTVFVDESFVRWMGRAAIVFEGGPSNGTVRNNILGGYSRLVHIENTRGGHLIENNQLLSSDIGVTVYDPELYYGKTEPTRIINNTFRFDQEYLRYPSISFGGRRAFIDFALPTPALNGTEIIGNKMSYHNYYYNPKNVPYEKPAPDDPAASASFITTAFPVPGLIVKDNEFSAVYQDDESRKVIFDFGTSDVWPPVKK